MPPSMTSDPRPPASDEADPEQMTTPAGQVSELEELADELGATTDGDVDSDSDSGESDRAPD